MPNRKVNSFPAIGSDGQEYTIVVWQEFTEVHSSLGTKELAGRKTYKTSDGELLNVISENEFKFVHKNINLTKK